MISRRNYFAITIVMFIIVFLFLSTGVITEIWNDYEVNAYEDDIKKLPGKSDSYFANEASETGFFGEPRKFVVYVGGEKMEEAVKVWVSYTKKNMKSYSALEECESTEWKAENKIPCMLVVDPDHIRWEDEKQLEYLEGYLENGSDVVFCNMPDVSIIKRSQRIRDLFGIRNVKDEQTKVNGVHLYDGFLLGGEAVYLTTDKKEEKKRQDMDLTLPWYELEAGTEVYMKGIMKEEDIESEDYPVIIWKKNYRGSCLMAVNGKYMEDFGGIGLLSAMTAQMEDYDLYPVVNAQSMAVANYPVLAPENEEELMNIYSRNMEGVCRDIIWPGIMTVYRRNQMGLSCMMAPQLDYEDDKEPDAKQLHYYMKNLNKEDTEVGLSGMNISGTSLGKKLEEDDEFIHESLPDYHIASFYAGNRSEEEVNAVMDEKTMSSVRTVLTEDRKGNEIVGYLAEHVTEQKVLSAGFTHTYRDDLRVRCVETMLGYTNIMIDVADALYPENEKDSWEKISEDLNWNVQNYWKGFQGFGGVTVSESDARIRRFLALDYSQEREDKNIYLKRSATEGLVWFILRTHDEAIERMKGGSFTKLDDDVYLLEVKEAEAVVTMKSTVMTYEY